MRRRVVRVAQSRMVDIQIGDVVNRADLLGGWFVVASVSRLFNGQLQAADSTALQTVSGHDVDMVCIQFVSEIDVPEQPQVEVQAAEASVDPEDHARDADGSDDADSDGGPTSEQTERPSVPASLSGLGG